MRRVAFPLLSCLFPLVAFAQEPRCDDDSLRTAFERMANAPGAAVTESSVPVTTLTSESTGSRVRVLARTARDLASERVAQALGFVLTNAMGRYHVSLIDRADLPTFARILTGFEAARARGLDHDTRQKYRTVGGLELETFWEGKERSVAITSGGRCPVSAYLSEPSLAALRDAVVAGIAALDSARAP